MADRITGLQSYGYGPIWILERVIVQESPLPHTHTHIKEATKPMLKHFTLEDSIQDTELNKQIRYQSQRILNIPDDRNFTLTEIKNAVEGMDNKKAPVEDGIAGEIFKEIFVTFPNYITTMYNESLRKGTFPKRWKRAKLVPIVKPGKEGSEQVT